MNDGRTKKNALTATEVCALLDRGITPPKPCSVEINGYEAKGTKFYNSDHLSWLVDRVRYYEKMLTETCKRVRELKEEEENYE